MQRILSKQYAKCVFKDKHGKIMLYVRLNKSLYGCLHAALIFYQKLWKELADYGFLNEQLRPVRGKQARGRESNDCNLAR